MLLMPGLKSRLLRRGPGPCDAVAFLGCRAAYHRRTALLLLTLGSWPIKTPHRYVLLWFLVMGACATTCFSSPGVAQQVVDVYVMAGQSNMDGRGLVKELAQSRPDLARPQPEIRYWYANPKLEDKGFSTGWIDLAPGYSIPPKYLRKKKTLPSHTFGAEVSFGPAMSQGAG